MSDLSRSRESSASPGYPDTLYDPKVPADRVNPNDGKIRERQDPRLVRGAVKISF